MIYNYQKLDANSGCWIFVDYYNLNFGDKYRVLTKDNLVCVNNLMYKGRYK